MVQPYSYNWLQKYFEHALPKPDNLAELLNTHSFEVEKIEKKGEGTENEDTVFYLNILPDRAHYALSHKGVAREIRAITRLSLKEPFNFEFNVSEVVSPDVKIGEPHLCSRYMARRIEGINVRESPAWLRSMLENIGSRSINLVVDATNFCMLDTGQPLHVFDADKVKGAIHVRLATSGEKITLLDGADIELLESDLLVTDDEGPLAIAGVKGGKRAEVTSETKNIIIESANFNPVTVRRTALRLNLRNESSKRFENEIIPELAETAMNNVTALISHSAPDAKSSPVVDVVLRSTKAEAIRVSREEIERIIGEKVSTSNFEKILSSLDISVTEDTVSKNKDSTSYILYPPLDRFDLKIEEDIADEVARLKGYEHLPSVLPPKFSQKISHDPRFYYSEKTKNILQILGFLEVSLYTLVPNGVFEIARPMASDKRALRDSILPKLRESLSANIFNADILGLDVIKIFEIGKVFQKTGEKTVLTIGVSFPKRQKGVTAQDILNDALVVLDKKLGVTLHAKIGVGGTSAFIELDFDAITSELPEPQDIKELDFEILPRDKKYKPFSLFPFIVRDVAFFAPKDTDDEDARMVVATAVYKVAGDLLIKGPDLFDEFEKGDKVSFAFRMIFQSFDRTLFDYEVNELLDKVYEAIKKEGWEPR